MTYFGVLATFILPPLILLAIVVPREVWAALRSKGPAGWYAVDRRPYVAILLHVIMALVYTTPWDNYLVATGVWWYDPELVTGLRIGYVPIEEYTFFVVQTLLTGLWTLGWMRWRFFEPAQVRNFPRFRLAVAALTFAAWLASTLLLFSGWQPGTYLALILSWALVPILIQLIFGADLLLANWRLVLVGILPVTLYLWWVDSLALTAGTWSIDPRQTTGIMFGALPLEEMLFFFITNVIIVFGMTLMLSPSGQRRAEQWLARAREIKMGELAGRIQKGARRYLSIGMIAIWLGVWIATPIAVWVGGDRQFAPMATLGVAAQFVAVVFAIGSAWSPGRVLRTMSIVVVLTWLAEWTGQATGFPFGSYRYTALLQPQLGGVPVIIPLAWMMMLFPAWAVIDSALARHRARLGRLYWPTFAALSGLAFTAWDLYLDPQMVARGLWLWEPASLSYFGIPLVNFAGWWLVSTALSWAIRPEHLPQHPLLAVYTLTWLFQAVGLGLFWGQPGPALAGFIGMGLFAGWAWRQEARVWKSWYGRWLDFSAAQSRSQS